MSFEPPRLACALMPRDRGNQPPRKLRPCDVCKQSFYCSDEHFETAHYAHNKIPSEDGHDNLSQYEINVEARWDSLVGNVAMLLAYYNGPFKIT